MAIFKVSTVSKTNLATAAERLRELADRLETRRRQAPPVPDAYQDFDGYKRQREWRKRLVWSYAVEAGRILSNLIQAGEFADDALMTECFETAKPLDGDGHANALFLQAWRHWLPERNPASQIPHKNKASYEEQQIDATRAIAEAIEPEKTAAAGSLLSPARAVTDLDRQEIEILDTLRSAGRLTQIALEAEPRIDLSRRAIGKRMKRLESNGYVNRPHGANSGYCLTDKARLALESTS